MRYLVCFLSGYLVGSFNPSYILARLHGFDIRTRGSHNAGASNALLLFGKARGFLCAFFDIFKAYLCGFLVQKIFAEDSLAFAVTASACILGHVFPFYMQFRGGKGLACLAGVILAFDLRVFGIMLACEIVIALATKYICFVPMSAAAAFPFVYGFATGESVGIVLLLTVAAVVLWRHSENIRRIRGGQEMRLSYLWNKEAELSRMRENYPEDEWDYSEME